VGILGRQAAAGFFVIPATLLRYLPAVDCQEGPTRVHDPVARASAGIRSAGRRALD
jgi:hypothetical protein